MDAETDGFPLHKQSRNKKVVKTVVIYIGFFILGTAFSVVGPSLLDLEIIAGAGTETISFVFTARSAFGLAGAIINGFIVEKLNPWFLLSCLMLLMSAAYIAVPFCTSIVAMIGAFGAAGFGGAAYDGGGNLVLLNIWGADHGPWMQALHAIFGAGAWMGPLIAKPFLAEQPQDTDILDVVPASEEVIMQSTSGLMQLRDSTLKQLVNTTVQFVLQDETTTHSNVQQLEETTEVIYAYLIVGLLCVFGSMLFVVVFMAGKRVILILWAQEDEPDTNEAEMKTLEQAYVIKLAALVFAFYVSYCILEMNYGNFLLAYAVKHLNWSKQMAASLTSAYWGSFTLGRVSGIITIRYLKPQTILIIDVIMCCASLVPILLFAEEHVAVLWTCTIVFGFFMSTIFATGITWTERYIPVTGRIGSVFVVAGAAGELLGPAVISILFKGIGPWSFMYVMFGASCLVALMLTVMQIVANRHGERYITPDKVKPDVEIGTLAENAPMCADPERNLQTTTMSEGSPMIGKVNGDLQTHKPPEKLDHHPEIGNNISDPGSQSPLQDVKC